VPESSATCQYCSAPLLIKACPACLSRVFAGHKFCPECGGGLDATAPGARRERDCPRCHVELDARVLGDVILDDCPDCGGTFVDRTALEMLLGEKRGARAESVLGAYDAFGDTPLQQPPGSFYVKCPDCGTFMNRKIFAYGAKVIVDVCRQHGTWFDLHELPRIIRFVMRGGLEQAARRELDEKRAQVSQQMAALRAAQGGAKMDTTHTSGGDGLFASLLAELLR
jgi:Zn-finger nucleic acid-binding protein